MTLRLPLLLAALMTLLPLPGALAQEDGDPREIARRCIELVEHRTDRAIAYIGETTQATIHRIRRLDAAGAPDEEIIAAGHAGAAVVNRTAHWATDSIQRLTRRCVHALIDAGASRELVHRVVAASRAAQDEIAGARERAVGAIRKAVREALG